MFHLAFQAVVRRRVSVLVGTVLARWWQRGEGESNKSNLAGPAGLRPALLNLKLRLKRIFFFAKTQKSKGV